MVRTNMAPVVCPHQEGGPLGSGPGELRMLMPFTAELSWREEEFGPVARAAVVAVPAPVRVAGRPEFVEGSGPRSPLAGGRSVHRPDPQRWPRS